MNLKFVQNNELINNSYLDEIERIDKPVIPLKVFMYWHSKEMPEKIKNNVEYLKKVNPEFEIIVYDDEMTKQFLKNNFEEEVINAYETLIPISFKSDLFRYCILYIYGGIYLDIKFEPINNFKLISLAKYDEVWCHQGLLDYDKSFSLYKKTVVNTGFILTKPNNIHLKIAIDNILYNVKYRIKTSYACEVTGPTLLTKSFNFDVMKHDKFKIRYFWKFGEKEDSNNVLSLTHDNDENLKSIFKFYDGYRYDLNKKSPQSHWTEMWKNNIVYRENK